MAEYKYVDWPGLQYYHSKVTELIDSKLRDCIKFGGELVFEELPSPDSPDLNNIYRITNSFSVDPSNEWFDRSCWNRSYSPGTVLQVVQTQDGVVYKVFLYPVEGSGNSDLSNYYTKAEVDQLFVSALSEYASVSYVTSQLELLANQIAEAETNSEELRTDLTELQDKVKNIVEPSVQQLEQSVRELETLVDTKADKNDIPTLDGYATEEFVIRKINEAELNNTDIDLSSYYTKEETDEAIREAIESIPQTDLSDYATTEFVTNELAKLDADGIKITLNEIDSQVDSISSAVVDLTTLVTNVSTQVTDLQQDIVENYLTKDEGVTSKQLEAEIQSAIEESVETMIDEKISDALTDGATVSYIDYGEF